MTIIDHLAEHAGYRAALRAAGEPLPPVQITLPKSQYVDLTDYPRMPAYIAAAKMKGGA